MRFFSKIIFSLSIVLLPAHLGAQEELLFHLKRDALFPNSYYFYIKNNGVRTLTFSGYRNDTIIVEFENGTRIDLDSQAMNEHHMKGVMWIFPGESGYIPFKMGRKQFQKAKRLYIKGTSAITKQMGSLREFTDDRDLVIVFDVESRKGEYKIGDSQRTADSHL